MTVLEHIHQWLTEEGVAFRVVRHHPTRTSAESAAVRGEPLEVGAKAIVMKAGKEVAIFVISAARRLDAKKVRAFLGVKKTRFITSDELLKMTGLVPGSVPPFGRPILDLDLFVDSSITQLDRVAFNAGSLTDSIIMPADDYLRLSKPIVFDFAQNVEA